MRTISDEEMNYSFETAYGEPPAFTGEPLYTKFDHDMINSFKDRCVIYTYVKNDETGEVIKYVDKAKGHVLYPDLLGLIDSFLTHLNRTAFLSDSEARCKLAEWTGQFFIPKYKKYVTLRDNDAVDILNNLSFQVGIVIIGDAKRGKRQDYDIRMKAERRLVSQDQTQNRGFLGRLF